MFRFTMENRVPNQLSGEALAQFRLGINLFISRWPTLQMAVHYGWGGDDSRQKAEQLPVDIVSLFNQIRDPVYDVQEVDCILVEGLHSLNAMVDDFSIYKIADKIMVMHKECLEGNFTSIERLWARPEEGLNDYE